MLYSRFCFLSILRLPRKVRNVTKPPFPNKFEGPNHDIDFVDENKIAADICPERLAQVLAAHLNRTATTLETFLSHTEHGDGNQSSATSQWTRR